VINLFFSFSTPQISSKLNNLGVSLGTSLDLVSVSTSALKHMEFDKLKCTSVLNSKPDTSHTSDDDD
jgi:hypothetical protein